MTRLLIVDDEPAQSRGLSRAIRLRRPEYDILTAQNGAEAVQVLERESVDLVMTDLHMAEMDGFALLAWLFNERPHVLAFAMTGYSSEESLASLRELGSIECFKKPLDVDRLVSTIGEGLAQSIRGHVHNVGLASFLQLVELERKTCVLEVSCDERRGRLFVCKGELLHAESADLRGAEAALAILSWSATNIAIAKWTGGVERSIDKPACFFVMEALRLRDEKDHAKASLAASDASLKGESVLPPRPIRATRLAEQTLRTLRVPTGTVHLALLDVATAQSITVHSRFPHAPSELTRSALDMLRQACAAAGLSGLEPEIEELLITTTTRSELIRPVRGSSEAIFLIFDPADTNPMMARLELELFLAEYRAA